MRAISFWLYDLDGDEFPTMIVQYSQGEGWAFNALYKFIDGEYRFVERFKHHTLFFTDPHGELVLMEVVHSHYTISYLGWNGNEMWQNIIVDDVQWQYIEWDYIEYLTLIEPLMEMEENVRENIIGRAQFYKN